MKYHHTSFKKPSFLTFLLCKREPVLAPLLLHTAFRTEPAMSWICTAATTLLKVWRTWKSEIGLLNSEETMQKNTRKISETCLVALMKMGTLKSLNYARGFIDTTRTYQRNWGVVPERSGRLNLRSLPGEIHFAGGTGNISVTPATSTALQFSKQINQTHHHRNCEDHGSLPILWGAKFPVGCLAEDLAVLSNVKAPWKAGQVSGSWAESTQGVACRSGICHVAMSFNAGSYPQVN